ncbi:unnamed protein product [Pleuronectes platessa]|uniref:Uncharacterized protein n=1 Tax=Pleuronectes platessa TaxID=8262 RepID=A0A9N7U8Q9_PLEPL|nr:unnamed protein product [Pleuronectes platessa]
MHRYCRLAGNLSALTDSQWSTESHPTVSARYCSNHVRVCCECELFQCGFPGSGQESVGHRAGIKQQNNGELPPLNLLMGSQWLPWLPPNYQPLDSLTSLHQAGSGATSVILQSLSSAAVHAASPGSQQMSLPVKKQTNNKLNSPSCRPKL